MIQRPNTLFTSEPLTPESLMTSLLTREAQFAAFSTGELLDFWRQREEGEFSGVDAVPIRFVRFTAPQNDKIVVVFSGRIESYVKYSEVAYDLFHRGYDVLIMDHRGQGRSGRMLQDGHRGHVLRFSDYVDDAETLCQQHIDVKRYTRRFALAHSMGARFWHSFWFANLRYLMRRHCVRRCLAFVYRFLIAWPDGLSIGRSAARRYVIITLSAPDSGVLCLIG